LLVTRRGSLPRGSIWRVVRRSRAAQKTQSQTKTPRRLTITIQEEDKRFAVGTLDISQDSVIYPGLSVIFHGPHGDETGGPWVGQLIMDRNAELLLDVWREVGRHLEIQDSVDRIGPLIGRRMPFDAVLVRVLEVERGKIETLVRAPAWERPGDPPTGTEATQGELKALLAWWRKGKPARLTVEAARRRLPGLLPAGLEGDVLCGPLRSEALTPGVVVLSSGRRAQFQHEHELLLSALLEPLAVAVESDQRIRELTSLREAAEADNRSLLARLGRLDIADSIVGAETGLKEIMEQVKLVARSDTPVLILGETGSGKEVVARAIHTGSRRASAPFLRINCGGISPDLVDSELFGHEQGSFTGAVAERKGWFERADRGTLFLDECGELPLPAQVRLLRVLQDGTFQRVGGEKTLHVDVRVVAATHRDLPAMVASGQFREDLWYRIAVFPVHLPPLRERLTDIPALASHFALRAAKRLGLSALNPSAEDLQLLVSYNWPGNVRELSAVIERAAILGEGKRLDVARALGAGAVAVQSAPVGSETPVTLATPAAASPFEQSFPSLDAAMIRHIEAALARTRGRVEGPDGAAAILQINPHTLRSRIRKLRIDLQLARERGR
jgi:hydrogenase-4 transcriptional activator